MGYALIFPSTRKNEKIDLYIIKKDSIKVPKKPQSAKSSKCSSIKIPAILTIVFLIGLLIAVLLYAAIVPCAFINCNKNSICFNQFPFIAKCKCNRGFNGNGIDCNECGLTNYNNYQASTISQNWPATSYITFFYSTSLFTSPSQMHYLSCGGVLINRKTILTTASCITNFFKNKYLIHELVDLTSTSTQQIQIQKIIIHDDFDLESNAADIAILKLSEPITLNQNVQVACIPDNTDQQNVFSILAANNSAISIGQTNQSDPSNPNYSPLSNRLLNTFSMLILPTKTSTCSNALRAGADRLGFFCAAIDNNSNSVVNYGSPSSCLGDLGGGIYTLDTINNDTKYLAIGLLSYNKACSLNVYTSLFEYVDWINEHSNY